MKTIAVTSPGKVEIIDTPMPKPCPYQALVGGGFPAMENSFPFALGSLCDWVREGKLSAKEFITHRFSIDEIGEALQAVQERNVIKATLSY